MIDSQLKERVKKFLYYCRVSNSELVVSIVGLLINQKGLTA